MKKTLKFFTVVLLSVMMLFAFAQPVCFAAPAGDDVKKWTSDEGANVDTSGLDTFVKTIVKVLRIAAVAVALIVLMVIGIQFIIGGTQQKADYKKALIPVAVGCALIVFGSYIVEFLFSLNGGN